MVRSGTRVASAERCVRYLRESQPAGIVIVWKYVYTGGWNIRSGFGPTTTGRLHFSTFCLPENVTVPLLWNRKRERERLRLVPVLISFPCADDATYASYPCGGSRVFPLPLTKNEKKFFHIARVEIDIVIIVMLSIEENWENESGIDIGSINNSKVGMKILLLLERWNLDDKNRHDSWEDRERIMRNWRGFAAWK